MKLEDIKKLPDKTPVKGFSGIVEKQYAPQDQTESDLKFSQHRQSFLIHDDSGEKLMVTIMKSALHILDPIEGHELRISAGTDEQGGLRGLLVNRWKAPNAKYESVVVKVYQEATIRAIPPSGGSDSGESKQAPTTTTVVDKEEQHDTTTTTSVVAQATTPFEKHLALAAYGYCLCLDKAEQVIADRPELQKDPQNQRAIATNFWMECKHHLQTLAIGGTKALFRGNDKTEPVATPKAKAKASSSADNQTDEQVVSRLHSALKIDPEKLSPKSSAALGELIQTCQSRGLWEKLYDSMLVALIAQEQGGTEEDVEHKVRAAADIVYDHAKNKLDRGNKVNGGVEKFLCLAPTVWKNAVTETLNQQG